MTGRADSGLKILSALALIAWAGCGGDDPADPGPDPAVDETQIMYTRVRDSKHGR